ncbi:hypothetical protein [Levilactobacillus humaensis]|uniref:hypothetical protein n=1 Tax=Levilactobacillus humaensis TaxID=2950375 RepID=UPI0021C3EA15|nr:hypothetical protein [Levilactobacillus humaensis]
MLITILMICYTVLALGLGWGAYSHRNRPFLVFHPEENAALSNILKVGGILLLLVGILSAIATALNNTVLILIALLAGIILILVLQILMVRWLPKA